MSLEYKLHDDLTNGFLVLSRPSGKLKDKNGDIPINLERALLILSGANTEWKLKRSLAKIEKINAKFQRYFEREIDKLKKEKESEGTFVDERSSFLIAEFLHKYLWKDKIERYNEKNSLLKKAVDRQLGWGTVGNAVALTSLYTVLIQRNIGSRPNVNVLIGSPKEKLRPFTRLKFRKGLYIDVDNAELGGYGCSDYGKTECEEDTEKNYLLFLSDVLAARGEQKFRKQHYSEALSDYYLATDLNSENSWAYTRIGGLWLAKHDYNQALNHFIAAKIYNPHNEEARKLYKKTKKAINLRKKRLNPNHEEIKRLLEEGLENKTPFYHILKAQ